MHEALCSIYSTTQTEREREREREREIRNAILKSYHWQELMWSSCPVFTAQKAFLGVR
jgi:hypothetical protein